ncbi:MAG: ATP-binding cassette domain-containing protein [Pseudomonadota bacterium]
MLALENVWMEYGSQVVLENVTLAFDSDEFVTIVGASGCGKSTFLKLLLGQEQPRRGSISLNGEPLSAEPDERRGVVFQRYSVFPHLRVLENVMLGLELEQPGWFGWTRGRRRQRIKAAAMNAIEAVGLTDAIGKFPSELSGGMQQRLAIAQSIVKRPQVLLLDEPFGALDPGTRVDMHELIRRVWCDSNMLVFMVTHDIQEGFALGTRLLVFDRVRADPNAPQRYGAKVTYDFPLERNESKSDAKERLVPVSTAGPAEALG